VKEKGFAPLERVPFNVCLRPPSQAMSLDPAVAVASRWTRGLGPPSIDAPAEDFWLIRLAKLEEDVVCVDIRIDAGGTLYKGNTRFRSSRIGLMQSVLLVVVCAVPGMLDAQAGTSASACGGNSTIDVLGAKPAAAARAFLAQLQGAVQANNKEAVAGMISYPLLVLRDGKRTRIPRKEALLSNYDRIFTTSVRDAVLQQTAQCLFGNSLGAMVGSGEVWFSEQAPEQWKIITVNETASAR
jgi:hypothetical protein